MFEDIPILTTKLHIPQADAEAVDRRRLLERMNPEAGVKLTFLSAPAGFGKSTLLAQWARQAKERPAWYSIDRGDNETSRFWRYIVAALNLAYPGFAERTLNAVKLMQPGHYELAITMLLNELERLERPIVLVLDDLHAVSNEALIASFAYFIEYLPAQVHVIAASRTEPAFKTARLVSRQWMTRLDTTELRFTPQEGRQFYLQCMALALPEEVVGEWVRRTEGWITAMKLGALSLQNIGDTQTPSAILQNFSGSSHLLEQYLLEEVFLQQSETIRRFLMDCSVLNRMNAKLCRAVTGFQQSQEMLERLENAHLFMIPLDDRQGWYRFHHLFAEFLYNRLDRTEQGRAPILLEQAGIWCEGEGLQEEALEYYLTGEHYERASKLLEAMTTKRLRVSTVWLTAQFVRIPAQLLTKHPFLYFSYVHMVMQDAHYAGDDQLMRHSRQMIEYAEQRYEDNAKIWSEEDKSNFWGGCYFLKSLHAVNESGDSERVSEYLQQSKMHKPNGTSFIFAQSSLSGFPSVLKEYPRADEFIDKTSRILLLKEMIQTLGDVSSLFQVCLAEMLYEYNELDEARQTAGDALNLAIFDDPHSLPEMLLAARLVLARIQRADDRREAAEETVRRTRQDVIELGMAGSLIYCDAELALLAAEAGDLQPAALWMQQCRIDPDGAIGVRQLYEYEYLARMLAAQGRFEEARTLTRRIIEAAKREKRFYTGISLAILELLLLYRTGDTFAALDRLAAVLLVSEPREYKRFVLDAGEPMAELLELLIESWNRWQEEERPSLGYVRSLLTELGRVTMAAIPSEELRLILTKQEQAVLRLLAKRKTNRDIADELGVGYGTVRSHLRNIYSKLMVTSRTEAIHIGEELQV